MHGQDHGLNGQIIYNPHNTCTRIFSTVNKKIMHKCLPIKQWHKMLYIEGAIIDTMVQ